MDIKKFQNNFSSIEYAYETAAEQQVKQMEQMSLENGMRESEAATISSENGVEDEDDDDATWTMSSSSSDSGN